METPTYRYLLPLAATVALLAGCSSPTETPEATEAPASGNGYPVRIENRGRTVTVPAAPSRAATIDQSATEIMLSLGLADRMAGTAGWNDTVLPELAAANEQVPAIGQKTVSLERLLDADPDFVYATFDWSFSEEGVGSRDRFDGFGVPTYQSPSECGGQTAARDRALTLQDMYDEIAEIATVFDAKDRGDQLITDLRSRDGDATGADTTEDVSLMWWYAATRTPYIAGCCGAPGIITDAVGAAHPFADSRQYWPEISWESILERDPDVLVLADLARGDDGDSAAAKIEFLESNPVARQLTAVKERRWIIRSGTAMDPSIHNIGAIETVASGLREMDFAGR
ncbi:ABC transporter substrate-binding protein [Mycolicibacterium neoaurum]|uniref:ABC transporter substrate-binding protein n=1 Tax=Mycolicibacterium neoaurum TaxID=1795 RepID=UPI002670E281|nr:ABC transporter substrate-binding protein [Mycolicibacterium neoaurum]MDO3399904.1 ABC transporter substrate-binding protein [Mycolicibacterium neoaurum]